MKTYFFHFTLLFTVLTFLYGCQGSGVSSVSQLPAIDQSAIAASSADDLVVVDCMLPGQVRRLGRMTYLTPRRPVKVTALECQIRGGEYVLYDRSNIKTALNVWLSKAKEGDPAAQNNVGEIYLRGLWGKPYYNEALEWFRKAAAQGFKRAQLNLGHMYEKGLGVPEDSLQALKWYRQATGLKAEIGFDQGGFSQEERRQFKQLEKEAAKYRVEAEGLRQQLHKTRNELQKMRDDFGKRKRRIESEQRNLERDQAELLRRKKALSGSDNKKLAQNRKELQHKLAELEAKQHLQIKAIQRELENARAEQQEYKNKHKADNKAQIAQIETKWKQKTASLEKQLKARIKNQNRELAAIKAELEGKRGLKSDKKELARLEKELQRKAAAIEKQRKEAKYLNQEIARLGNEAKTYKKRLQRSRKLLAKADGPKIEIIDPVVRSTRGIRVAPIGAGLKKRQIVGRVVAPAEIFSLLINGKAAKAGDNGMFKVAVAVKTRGKTKINIVAVDKNGKSATALFELLPQAEKKRIRRGDFGRYHALLIGNNHYKKLPKLETASGDARAIGAILQADYGFEVKVLVDATRYDILSALNDYRKKLTKKDNFLIYYAGHGELVEKNRRGYWLPTDADPDSDVNWLPNYQITDILNIMAARQVMVIADTCYSGALTRSGQSGLEAGKTEQERLEWLKTLARKRSRRVISSGELKPVLDSAGGEHSVFAGALITALKSNQEVLEGLSLYRKIAANVSFASEKLGLQQVPQYSALIHAGHESGDFIFVPKGG